MSAGYVQASWEDFFKSQDTQSDLEAGKLLKGAKKDPKPLAPCGCLDPTFGLAHPTHTLQYIYASPKAPSLLAALGRPERDGKLAGETLEWRFS